MRVAGTARGGKTTCGTTRQRYPRRTVIAGLAMLAAFAAQPAGAQNIANYQPVTEERLLKPEPQNWLMYPRKLRTVGLQPTRPDHDAERAPAQAGMDAFPPVPSRAIRRRLS